MISFFFKLLMKLCFPKLEIWAANLRILDSQNVRICGSQIRIILRICESCKSFFANYANLRFASHANLRIFRFADPRQMRILRILDSQDSLIANLKIRRFAIIARICESQDPQIRNSLRIMRILRSARSARPANLANLKIRRSAVLRILRESKIRTQCESCESQIRRFA